MPHSVNLRRPREHSSASIAERRACACNHRTTEGLQGYLEYVYIGALILKIIRRRSFITAGSTSRPGRDVQRKSRARTHSFSLAPAPFSRRVFR